MNKIFSEYNIQISSPDMFTPTEDILGYTNHTWHGSAVMWHSSLDSSVESLKTLNERFTGVKINVHSNIFIAISVYFPTSGKDAEFLECISDLSNFIRVHREGRETILIGTDSNCSDKSSPRRKQALRTFCEEFDLFKSCCNHPTFHHPNGSSESNIDYFLVSAKSSQNLQNLTASCTLENPENFSSHDPISASLKIKCEKSETKSCLYSSTYTDFTQKKIIWNQDNLDTLYPS